MSNFFSFVLDLDPEAFNLGGFLSIHWSVLLAALGLLAAFEFYLYQIKNSGITALPVRFFVLVVLSSFLGAKIIAIIFSAGSLVDNLYKTHFSLIGGVYFMILTCLLFYKKEVTKQAKLVDTSLMTVLVFLIFQQVGVFLEPGYWGKPTYANNGVVFTSESTDLLKGIFDKVKQAEVIRSYEYEGQSGMLPVNIKLHFIDEVNNKKDAGHFLNADFKNSIEHYPSFNAHFDTHLPDQLAFQLEEVKENKLLANVHVNGILRHPVTIYKGIVTLLILLLVIFLENKGKFDFAGEKGAWVLIQLILTYFTLDYFFSVNFYWPLLSEKTLGLILVFAAVWYLYNVNRLRANSSITS